MYTAQSTVNRLVRFTQADDSRPRAARISRGQKSQGETDYQGLLGYDPDFDQAFTEVLKQQPIITFGRGITGRQQFLKLTKPGYFRDNYRPVSYMEQSLDREIDNLPEGQEKSRELATLVNAIRDPVDRVVAQFVLAYVLEERAKKRDKLSGELRTVPWIVAREWDPERRWEEFSVQQRDRILRMSDADLQLKEAEALSQLGNELYRRIMYLPPEHRAELWRRLSPLSQVPINQCRAKFPELIDPNLTRKINK